MSRLSWFILGVYFTTTSILFAASNTVSWVSPTTTNFTVGEQFYIECNPVPLAPSTVSRVRFYYYNGSSMVMIGEDLSPPYKQLVSIPTIGTTGRYLTCKAEFSNPYQIKGINKTGISVFPAGPSVQNIKTAVIMVNFTSHNYQPVTTTDMKSWMFTDTATGFGINHYYQSASHGFARIRGVVSPTQGDVFGWYTLPDPQYECNDATRQIFGRQIMSQVNQMAVMNGFVRSAYDNVVFLLAMNATTMAGAGCRGWADESEKLSFKVIVNGTNGILGLQDKRTIAQTIAHELGHSALGMQHGNLVSCSQSGVQVPMSNTCNSLEYGDGFTLMGNSELYLDVPLRHFSNLERHLLGWMDPSRVQTIGAGISNQVINLKAHVQSEASGIQTIRIYRRFNEYFYLEYRRPVLPFDNFASTDRVVNGITVRLDAIGTNANGMYGEAKRGQLIHGDPSLGNFNFAPLLPGQSFTDTKSGVKITALTGGNTSQMPVRVEVLPINCATPNPPGVKLLVSPEALKFPIGPGTLDIPFEITNGNSNGCNNSPTAITLSSNVLVANWFTGQFLNGTTINLNPGQKYQGIYRVTSTGNLTLPGLYNVIINAAFTDQPSITGNSYLYFDYVASSCVRQKPSITSNVLYTVPLSNAVASTDFVITNNDSATCPSRTFYINSMNGGLTKFVSNITTDTTTLAAGASVTKNYTWTWKSTVPQAERVPGSYSNYRGVFDAIYPASLSSNTNASVVFKVVP
jgi:M6 family metalloprotease-like protein